MNEAWNDYLSNDMKEGACFIGRYPIGKTQDGSGKQI